MGTSRGPSSSRLETIMGRQDLPTWDANYVPAILAIRTEAPSMSHALTITPEKLTGREVHLLSLSEFFAALLGLYHPNVVGLQEQRMLSPGPRQTPFNTFPVFTSPGLLPSKA